METFFQDNFINKKLLEKVKKEIRENELNKTIKEINYLNEIQSYVLKENKYGTDFSQKPDFIKKLDNARQKQNL